MRHTGWNLVRALAGGIRVARFMCIQFLCFVSTRRLFGNYLLFLMHILAPLPTKEGSHVKTTLLLFGKRTRERNQQKILFPFGRGGRAQDARLKKGEEQTVFRRGNGSEKARAQLVHRKEHTRNVPVGGPSPVPSEKALFRSTGKTLPEHSRKNRPHPQKFGFCPFSRRF